MRKIVYIARVIKSDDGWYAIDFPDLPGTHTQCKTIDEVETEAEKSLKDFLLASYAVGEEVQPPSLSIDLQKGEMAVIISAIIDSEVDDLDSVPIAESVFLPRWMVEGAKKAVCAKFAQTTDDGKTYRVIQDGLYQSDFDKLVMEIEKNETKTKAAHKKYIG